MDNLVCTMTRWYDVSRGCLLFFPLIPDRIPVEDIRSLYLFLSLKVYFRTRNWNFSPLSSELRASCELHLLSHQQLGPHSRSKKRDRPDAAKDLGASAE